jgi:hypothetical protein
MKYFSLFLSFLFLLFLLPPPSAAGTVLMNNFGYMYETGGFPSSAVGDALEGVGVVTAVSPPINCDLNLYELTWSIRDLLSQGEFSPDGGRTIIVSYSGGTIHINSDPLKNHDFGINPPNATAPVTFEDGDQFLVGSFTQFVMFYDTQFQVGSFQGLVDFTTGTNLADLGNPNGMIFAGTIGPGLDPNIPQGYSLEVVGRIIAPSFCTVKGNVSYVYNPDQCEKCKGITRLVLTYNGTEDPANAGVSCGAQVEVSGNDLIITPDTTVACSDEHEHHEHYKLPKETTISVGADQVTIHTSCSRPIDPGNVIDDFTVSAVDKIVVPCEEDEEEKCEGITRLVLLYNGFNDPTAVSVSDGAYATVSGDTLTLLPTGTKFKANTEIIVGDDSAIIHTSCSQPLEPGFIYGEFEVLAVDKILPQSLTAGGSATSGPVVGATVDLIDGEGNIFTTLTDVNGDYVFFDVATETVMVNVVVPLGYVAVTPTDTTLVCAAGDVAVADFVFERKATQDKPRSVGFWKHQVNDALKGKHKGVKVPADQLLAFFDQLHQRFDKYFGIFMPVQTLQDFKEVLSPKKKATHYDKARSQFAALLLNVVSNRLSTWQFVSKDEATVSQAITYISDLLTDADPSNDELAKDIAERINKGEKVGAGVIPLSITQIAYVPPPDDNLYESKDVPLVSRVGNYPNPFNPQTTISYELGASAPVELAVYDIRGRKVRSLVRGEVQAGYQSVTWNGTDDSGRTVASGVYFYRLRVGDKIVTRRMVLVR